MPWETDLPRLNHLGIVVLYVQAGFAKWKTQVRIWKVREENTLCIYSTPTMASLLPLESDRAGLVT